MAAPLTRREFATASLAGLAAVAVGGCSDDQTAYLEAVEDMTRPLPADANSLELVRYATLAANGHNTQPWRFHIGDRGIGILPDFERRTPAVDPDDHHLFASLGCAAENLSIAARARGMSGEVRFDASQQGSVHVDLQRVPAKETDLFRAIPSRQCSRATYDGKPAPSETIQRLMAAASSHAVEAVFIRDRKQTEEVLSLVIEGNSRQIDDPAFIAELKHWIRFNPDAALATRDGIYAASSGNPTLPSWLGPIMFDALFRKQPENDKYAEQVRSSAGIVVFIAKSNDKAGWFSAGRAYERFALQATVDGLKNAFINQAVEVPDMRRELAALLGLGSRRPNLVVRFGYGPFMAKSLRRRVSDVTV